MTPTSSVPMESVWIAASCVTEKMTAVMDLMKFVLEEIIIIKLKIMKRARIYVLKIISVVPLIPRYVFLNQPGIESLIKILFMISTNLFQIKINYY